MTASSGEFAVIGGTGLSSGIGLAAKEEAVATPYGPPSSTIDSYRLDSGGTFLFLPRHGKAHHLPPHKINYRANLWALKQLGVERIVAVNAVGGITADMVSGRLIVPDQIIDYSWGREQSFSDGTTGSELQHIDFSYPFDDGLRQLLLAESRKHFSDVADGGVYGVTQGPRLETAAEINRMERDGCDIVGMTAMPEAALARELNMAYASLCLVVNAAAGRSDSIITMQDIQRVLDEGMETIRSILLGMAKALS